MNKLAIAFLAAVSLASFGCKKKGGGDAVEAMKKYKADLCACKDHDVECGKKAADSFAKATTDSAKTADTSAKPDPEVEKIQADINACSTRVMTPDTGAAGTPPAGGTPPAAGSDTTAPAGGTPPAGGSDGSAAAPAGGTPPAGSAADTGSAAGSGSAK